MYRVRVSLGGPTGETRDAVIEVPAGASAREIVGLLTTLVSASGAALSSDGQTVTLDEPVASTWLHDGAILRVDGVAGPTVEQPRWALQVESGPAAGSILPVGLGVAVLGRGGSAQIRLLDDEVSRAHLEVNVQAGGVSIRDLGSSNGSTVNDAPISGDWRSVGTADVIGIGQSTVRFTSAGSASAALTADDEGGFLVNRQFRIRDELRVADLTRPAPPSESEKRSFPWLTALAPLVIALVLALLLSPIYLAFALLSPVTVAASFWQERRTGRRRATSAEGSYDAAVHDFEVKLADQKRTELDWLRVSTPAPFEIVATALSRGARIWERRPVDTDFLQLRMGTGQIGSRMLVRSGASGGQEHVTLDDAPVSVGIVASPVLGVAGAATEGLVRSLVLQACTLQTADDVRLIVLTSADKADKWGYARWLPHARLEDGVSAALGFDAGTTHALIDALSKTLERRKPTGLSSRTEAVLPVVIVVLDGAHALRRDPRVATLLREGPMSGFVFVCIDDGEELLPEECSAVVTVDAANVGTVRIRGSVPVTGIAVESIELAEAERCAQSIAPLRRVSGERSAGLVPATVRLVDELGPGVLTPEVLVETWAATAGGASAPLGRSAAGAFVIDLETDGPHALVAGTTGSGKSKFLQALLLGLAARHSPTELSLLLVDFKGGGDLGPLAALPHTVGLVTNLDADTVTRATRSLRAELTRRQNQLAAYGCSDLSGYAARRRSDPSMPYFPRLVLAVDEFAELKDLFPTAVDELVAIARTGRSLGVHLILATQRPSGVVTGEIKSNTNLRVCLRVRDAMDSLDVVDRPDAADIPSERPGRAFASVGGGELVEFQSCIASLPRQRTGPVLRGRLTTLTEVANCGWPDAPYVESGPTDIDDLVAAIRTAADLVGARAPYLPWQAELPAFLSLGDLGEPLAIGRTDVPEQQSQPEFTLVPGRHVAVIGSARSGRSTALTAAAAAIAWGSTTRPRHLYVIDPAGSLADLSMLPTVGTLTAPRDMMSVDRLLTRLTSLVHDRLGLLTERRFSSLAEWYAASPHDCPAEVWLLVDRWEEVFDPGQLLARNDQIDGLLSSGPAAGVTVIAAGDEALLRGRSLARFPRRIILSLNNPADAALAGVPPTVSTAPGRGVTGEGHAIQVGVAGSAVDGESVRHSLILIAQALPPAGAEGAPFVVRTLPGRLRVSELPAAPVDALVLGLAGDEAAPVLLPVGAGAVIAGPRRSGRTSLLTAIGQQLVVRGLRVATLGFADPLSGAVAIDQMQTSSETYDVVLVDDAERINAQSDLGGWLADGRGGKVIAATDVDAWSLPNMLLRGVHRSADTVLLLTPTSTAPLSGLGLRLDRSALLSGPPGRGYAVIDGAEPLLFQSAI